MNQVMPDYPLSGVTVLEITGIDVPVAGSYCTKLLADYGAQVIRIDSPSNAADFPETAQFLYLNTNKKSLTADLTTSAGFATLTKRVAQADMVVESTGPDGLDVASLQQINPEIILASISWFGRDGPYSRYKGSDITAQALSGIMHFTGMPDREPLKIAGPQAEYQAGVNAAVAVLTALRFRDETGRGQHIDISVMEVMASILEGALLSYAYDGTVRSRDGARHPTVCPSTILPCKDGFVHVDASTEWETFARFTGIEKLLDFDSQTLREQADEIDALLKPWLAEYTREEIFKKAQEWRLPFATVMGVHELPDDPQFQARGYFERIDHPSGSVDYPGAPFKMSAGDYKRGRAPLPGEHNSRALEDPKNVAPDATEYPLHQQRVQMPLEGLRVLDLSQVYAGPHCARLLADMGAEVIRVESAVRSGRGGLTPQPGAVYPDGYPGQRPYNRSAYYNELHRNKLAVSLDLSKKEGQGVFKRLVLISDVLIENFSPRVMANFGLTYPVLAEINPGLVMASISAYGQTGPYRDYVSFGRGIEAMSGLAELTAYENGPPLGPGIAYADANAGLHAAFAILMALKARRRSEKGQHIDLSLRESMSALLGPQILECSLRRTLPKAKGNTDSTALHQGCYRCKGEDQWVAISIHTQDELTALTNILGEHSPGDNPHRRIETWSIQHGAGDAMHILQKAGIRAGKVCGPQDLIDDPHLSARGFFENVTHPEAGNHLHPGMPWKMSLTPSRIRLPAPCFAQHNGYVFSDLLGLSEKQMEAFEQAGIITTTPTR